MKTTVKASVAGIGFVFDNDAYLALKAYLEKIAHVYKNTSDGPEIVADIEARAAEIILSRQDARRIVGIELANDIISQLGYPEEMTDSRGNDPDPSTVRTFPRRLYRNREGAKLGGVFTGLATFFNIDPVWLRLLFFTPLILCVLSAILGTSGITAFMGGMIWIFLLVYVIMWIVIPAARTPRQKLEMNGEKITVSSIGAAGGRRDDKAVVSVWTKVFSLIGKMVLAVLKFCIFVVMGAIAVICVFAVVMIGMLLTGHLHGLSVGTLCLDSELTALPVYFKVMLLLLFAIPAFIVIYQILRMILRFRNSRFLMAVLMIGWILLVATVCVRGVYYLHTHREGIFETNARRVIERMAGEYEDGRYPVVVFNGDTIRCPERVKEILNSGVCDLPVSALWKARLAIDTTGQGLRISYKTKDRELLKAYVLVDTLNRENLPPEGIPPM